MGDITVIIPTLCLSLDMMTPTLEQLESNSNIKSILIFDNTQGDFKSNLSKVKIYNKENLFVNPAWNRGMELCDTEYYLIINDDIICSSEVVSACFNVLNHNRDIDLITVSTINVISINDINLMTYFEKNDKPEFIIQDSSNQHYQGWFLFGKKSSWKSIPDELKIFYGDTLIYDRAKYLKNKVAYLTNYNIYHRTSTTSNSEKTKNKPYNSTEQLDYEAPFYKKCKDEFLRKSNSQ